MKTKIIIAVLIVMMKTGYGQSFFNPGISYKVYTPSICDTLEHFSGISLKANLFQSEDHEGLYYRSYVSVEQLRNPQKEYFFCYSFGLAIGFEKKVHRNFLIPFFGAEYGNMYIKGVGKSGHVTPLAGISLIEMHNIELSTSFGYKYPFFQQEYAGFITEFSLIFKLHQLEF